MIWRSVVAKLWITIIGLVALVLILLSLFLTQFFDRFYYDQELDNVNRLAEAVHDALYNSTNFSTALQSITELVEGENRKLFIYSPKRTMPISSPLKEIISDERFQSTLIQGERVSFRGIYPVNLGDRIDNEDFLVVAYPIMIEDETQIIIIFESLQAVTTTIEGINGLVLYATGIGILLTTAFAFFLLSRVTKPLIEMKETAVRIANGDFRSRVRIRTHDEIGELGNTLNHMAEQLEETVHMLSNEKERLSSILKSMADGVISVDLDMNINLINPQAEKIMKYRKDGFDQLPEPFQNLIRDCIEKKEEVNTDVEIKGTILSVVVSPLYNRKEISGAVIVFRDVTSERKLDKLRKDFVANISHELRTPISMLQGYSEAILDGIAATPEEQRELVGIIFDESVRMNKLVNELLDFARMEAGHMQINPVACNMEQFLNKIMKKFNGIAKEANITLAVNNALGSQTVYFDSDRMEQVFTNLIDNAVRLTPEHGQITITVYKKQDDLHIEIADTGCGISSEDLPFLFERFYKADKARTRGRSGTGLGLSIVKHIVEAHKGRIFVDSTVGEGTTFFIQIPQESLDATEKS